MTKVLTINQLEQNIKRVEKGAAKGNRYLILRGGIPIFRIEPSVLPKREKKYSPKDILEMIRRIPKRKGPKTNNSLRVDEILYEKGA